MIDPPFFFFAHKAVLKQKVEKKNPLFFRRGTRSRIVQVLARPSKEDTGLAKGKWLLRESHPHSTQPTNQNVAMGNYLDPHADSGTQNSDLVSNFSMVLREVKVVPMKRSLCSCL